MQTSLKLSKATRLKSKQFIRFFMLAVCVFTLSACAGMGKKFRKTTVADVGVFTDHTFAMLSEADFTFAHEEAIYTREYYDRGEIEEQQWFESKARVEQVLNVMLTYSLALVTIAETVDSTQGRVRIYADYLNRIDDPVLRALGLEKDYFDDLIKNVRGEKDLLGALRKAQPIINAMGRYMEQALSAMDTATLELIQKVDEKIDHEYRDIIRYQATLEQEKYAVLGALEQLYLIAKGNPDAYGRLKASGTILSKKLTPAGKLSKEDLRAMRSSLMERLNRRHQIASEIEADWKLYRAKHRELDNLHEKIRVDIRLARLRTLVWIRAHQKMASGRVNPAEWFDIDETPALLFKIGKSAVPIPGF